MNKKISINKILIKYDKIFIYTYYFLLSKEIIHEYNNPIVDEKSIIVLQRAIELYLETIVPIQDKIRRASYAYNEVEIDNGAPVASCGAVVEEKKYSLIQEKHTLQQLEINLPEHEPEVKNMKLR